MLRESLKRKEAIEEASGLAYGEPQGCTECRRVPAPCVHQRPPRPVQTGGGRSVTPSSTQLVSLGLLLFFGWSDRPSPSWSSLFRDRQFAALPDWSFLWGAEAREGRLQVLIGGLAYGTAGELMWTSVKRVGTRGIRPPLVPYRTCDDLG